MVAAPEDPEEPAGDAAASDDAAQAERELAHVLAAQRVEEDLAANKEAFSAQVSATGQVSVRVEVDGEDHAPAAATCRADDMPSCKALEEDSINRDERVIERQALGLEGDEPAGGDARGTVEVTRLVVDDVPRMDSPLGWTCLPQQFDDGMVCDCDCGIWDPDCDAGLTEVSAVRSPGTDELTLIDREHAETVLNVLDGDGNANGVIDSIELTHLQRFGVSALFGVAERIVRAQAAGNNEGGRERLGNFARMPAAEAPASCGGLLEREGLLPSSLAEYTPMCVRDAHFATLVEQPTGRCALQPRMAVGSQCFVPGNGMPVAEAPVEGNGSVTKTPSSVSVCGLAGRIFRAGQGVGGLRSAGVGASTAGLTLPGGEFLPGTGRAHLDVKAAGLERLSPSVGQHGFSFYAVLRLDRLVWDAPIFAFGDSLDSNYVQVFTLRESHAKPTLRFQARAGAGHVKFLDVRQAVRLGQATPMLFTVSREGRMTVWRRGVQVGGRDGVAVSGPYATMYVAGGTQGTRLPEGSARRRRRHAGFEGAVTDIRIWDRQVSWFEAVAGSAEGQDPRADEEADEDAEVDVPCIASQRNTWDFVCADTLPEELIQDFGYTGGSDANAKQAFETREDRGEVTSCGDDVSVKGFVYHGQFGDGLTGEYFRMRTGCGAPFLFGQLPYLVRVDPTVDFAGGFDAAYNEYAIRWTGKLLVASPGTYKFKLGSKDSAWLAVGGRLLVDNGGCHSVRSKEGSVELDKGSHQIAVLYANRGPAGSNNLGMCRLAYSGPDTGGQVVPLPQERLGSAPMRLSQLGRGQEAENATQKVDVMPGYFVYDEARQLAVMPRGACDVACRRGARKAGAAPIRFFCSAVADVSFVARVSAGAPHAMVWLDEGPLQTWELQRAEGASFLQEGGSAAGAALGQRRAAASAATAEQALSYALGVPLATEGDDFDVIRSAPSPLFKVLPGEHTLYVQGRVEDDQAFALQRLRLEQGSEHCRFFLEGQDKAFSDCSAR